VVGASLDHVWLMGTVIAAALARPHPGGTHHFPDMGPTLPSYILICSLDGGVSGATVMIVPRSVPDRLTPHGSLHILPPRFRRPT
jgi:hypothetical protein